MNRFCLSPQAQIWVKDRGPLRKAYSAIVHPAVVAGNPLIVRVLNACAFWRIFRRWIMSWRKWQSVKNWRAAGSWPKSIVMSQRQLTFGN